MIEEKGLGIMLTLLLPGMLRLAFDVQPATPSPQVCEIPSSRHFNHQSCTSFTALFGWKASNRKKGMAGV